MRSLYLFLPLLSIVCLLNSCKKKETPYVPVDHIKSLSITGFSPQLAYVGDTITMSGHFFTENVKETKVEMSIARDESIKFPVIQPISITATEIRFVMPLIGTDSNYYEENITVSVNMVIGDTTYNGSADSLIYERYIDANFWPSRARIGQVITLQSYFEKVDRSLIKIQFSGSTEWLAPIGWDSFSDNRYYGVMYRVPANATNGPIKYWMPSRKAIISDSNLKILPQMQQLQNGTWVRQSDFSARAENDNLEVSQGGREDATVFVIENKAYVVCGNSLAPLDGYGSNSVWEYDPQYNSWIPKASFPGGQRAGAVGFSIGGKGYIATGSDKNGILQNDFWEFDPKTNLWARKANIPGPARANAVAFSIGNKGYLGAGENENSAFADFYTYDPNTDAWQTITPMPVERGEAYAFTVGNQGYVGGGHNASGGLSDLYMFDANAGSWLLKTGIPNYDHTCKNAATSLNDRGYVGLGTTPFQGLTIGNTKVFAYNPSLDTWNSIADISVHDRSGGVGFAINNAIFFGLGTADGKAESYRDLWGYMP